MSDLRFSANDTSGHTKHDHSRKQEPLGVQVVVAAGVIAVLLVLGDVLLADDGSRLLSQTVSALLL